MNKLTILAITIVIGTIGARGGNPYTEIADRIVASNPELAARSAQNRAEALDMKAENNLADPEVGFDYRFGSPQGTVNKWSLSVSQEFAWPGLYGARSRAANAAATARDLRLAAAENDLRLQVQLALIEYVNASRTVELLSKVHTNLDSIEMATRRLYDAGEATVLDVNKLAYSHFDICYKLSEAKATRDLCQQAIYTLNGGQYIDLAAITDYPDYTLRGLDDYLNEALAASAALSAARADITAAESSAQAARLASFPGFSLGYIHESEGPENFDGITAGLRLPLFSNRGRQVSARLMTQAAHSSLIAEEAALRAEITEEYTHARNDADCLSRFAHLFEDNNTYLHLVKTAYHARQITTLAYLTEIQWLLTTYEDYNALLFNYNLRMAKLERYSH